jgi:hypothetical protein
VTLRKIPKTEGPNFHNCCTNTPNMKSYFDYLSRTIIDFHGKCCNVKKGNEFNEEFYRHKRRKVENVK